MRKGRHSRWPAVVSPRRRRSGSGTRAKRAGDDTVASAGTGALVLDGGVVASTSILTLMGVVMIYSTTASLDGDSALPPLFLRHLLYVSLAVATAAVAYRVPIAWWHRMARPLWWAAVVLLALTLVTGLRINAATRWLAIPGLGITFQPAELAKIATLLVVAGALVSGGGISASPLRKLQLALLLALPPAALLLAQPDFGNTAVLLALVGLLLFVSGIPLRHLGVLTGLGVAGAGAFVASHPYAVRRFSAFLDPWERAHAEGFQLVQSYVAFGRGGGFGVGLGDGRQKLGYLPEAYSDFILSVVGEELGLAGVLVVLAAFAALVVAGFRIARQARDPYAQLLAFGTTALIAVPAAVNAAVVMGLVPTTGFTLPFLSYGGTSLLTCALAVGILLRVAASEPPRDERIAAPPTRGASQW